MRRWFEDPRLPPVPREELLGDLRPVEQYRVDSMPRETNGGVEVRRYLISGMRRNGVDVDISLRLFLVDPDDRRVLLTLPGGAGRIDDGLMTWLARHLGANHAVVDWVGRGQSGSHAGLEGAPDPLFMNGDSFRDCFQFYNVAAIWSALNWLFHAGYEPKDVVGGSWGGVYCFLLAAIDSRVERIFSSFGCGGFVLPGIEKRNYWDFAIEHIGPDRFAAWCAAFDPILRMSDVGAEVYFETATNDKFFSLDMAMETWRRVRRQNFLSLAHNQDHRMGLNGLQPYRIQKLPSDSPVLAECRAASRKHLTWEVGSDTVLCWPLSPAEKALSRLVVSEQLPRHGNMSREWRTVEPMGGVAEAALFRIEPTHLDAGMLYYLDREVAVEGSPFKVATPVVGDTARSRALAGVVPALAHGRLLDAELETLLHAPVGDKMAPRIVADDRGWTLAFSGARRLRTMRFGVRPWLLPAGWSAVRLVLAGPTDDKTGRLHLILSTAYNTRAERAVGQRLSAVASVADGGKRIFHFRREAFAPFSLFDGRFGDGPPLGSMETVAGEFDAIGLADPEGGEPVEVSIVSIVVQ